MLRPPEEELAASAGETPQGALAASGAAAFRGRFVGPCSGPVLMELRAAGHPGAVASARFDDRVFVFYVPPVATAALRYGCDADGDGTVPADAVRTVRMDTTAALDPLLLPLQARVADAYADLTLPAAALLPVPHGPAGPPVHATPSGAGPAGAAVGPPLNY